MTESAALLCAASNQVSGTAPHAPRRYRRSREEAAPQLHRPGFAVRHALDLENAFTPAELQE